jgi:elongation factor P
MITTADFKKGLRVLINNEPFQIIDFTVQSPTARGGGTLVKLKARSLITGFLTNETIKSGTKFDEPDLRFGNVQYLYMDGTDAVFMNTETYDQFNLTDKVIAGTEAYLSESLKIKALYYNGNVINIEIPQHVILEVTMVEPGERGNTSSGNVMTGAELSNGMKIKVPINTKVGQMISVDTETGTYHQRA